MRAAASRSRAARREVNPSLDVDKSLLRAPRAQSTKDNDSTDITAAIYNSGVTKQTKKQKAKPKSRAQRLRQEKGAERAERVLDRTTTKVDKSYGKGRIVTARKVFLFFAFCEHQKLRFSGADDGLCTYIGCMGQTECQERRRKRVGRR